MVKKSAREKQGPRAQEISRGECEAKQAAEPDRQLRGAGGRHGQLAGQVFKGCMVNTEGKLPLLPPIPECSEFHILMRKQAPGNTHQRCVAAAASLEQLCLGQLGSADR